MGDNWIRGHMYPIIWSFGPINIYSHGLMMALGALIGGVLLYFLARRKNLPTYFILDLILFSMLAGLVGARLLFFLLYLNQFDHWYEVFFVWWGGLVSFGGLFAGLLTAALYLKNKQQSVWQWFDLSIAGILVGWAIGRVGCFLTGDVMGINNYPVTLAESGWCLVAAGLCLALIFQKRWTLKPGMIFSIGLGLYGLGRLIIDFLREENIIFWRLNLNQWGDILVLALAIIFFFIIMKKGFLGGRKERKWSSRH
jgi:phosphatidylglycerol:prolipoprotein diacylglycerol transferase